MHQHQIKGEEPLESLGALFQFDERFVFFIFDKSEKLISVCSEVNCVAKLFPMVSDLFRQSRTSVA